VVILPGTGPDTNEGVVTMGELVCCAFVHPAMRAVRTSAKKQRMGINDLFISYHWLFALSPTIKN
ncbi:MAG: hypothetical protein LUQ54_01395, partial [Methanoregula sp.]|nr:hypothetical protein [Methanoregula sp.]